MNIRMLIVDDEPVICQGLVQTIPWESLGVEVVDTAFNGKQALQKLEQQSIDLILTDISMPEMDGLALAEYMVQEYPDTKMIIISGFDNFDYARQALRLGIEDYLLKPVDVDELMGLVRIVTKKIVMQKEKKRSQVHDWIAQLLLHALFHTPVSETIKAKQDTLFGAYRLLISEVSGYSQLQETLPLDTFEQMNEMVKSVVGTTLETCGIQQVSLFGHENELLTLCYSEDPEVLSNWRIHDVWTEVMKQTPYPLQTVASSIGGSFSTCFSHYQQALRLLDHQRGHGEGISFEGVQSDKVTLYPAEAEVALLEAVLKHDESRVETCIAQTVSELAAKGQSLSHIVHVCRELELVLKRKLQERLPNKAFDDIELRLQGEVDLRLLNTSTAIEQIFLRDMVGFLGELKENEHNHWVIENIKRYINKHYQQDLRAAEVAELHFITPNYFSMLFKQETGQSFSEYLNGLRIQKSSELLLNTSNKVFEIAEYVGYKEYKYFVQVFKKQVGLTPTHYRRLNASHETRKKQI
ncbi:response regulator transcription factor [Shouchella patagoniensis]|uniref:response regulator transcription factor n=1 Tax=Shouchella patagoniensis TaxID=228576 RepID=UPI001474BA66|nr:response regulator [Shouchella patagoniensis]